MTFFLVRLRTPGTCNRLTSCDPSMRSSDHAIIWESSRDPIAAIASHCDRYLVKIK